MAHTPTDFDKTSTEKPEHGQQLERLPSLNGSIQVEDVEPVIHWRTWLVVVAACLTYMSQVSVVSGTGFWRANAAADIGGADIDLWLSQAFQVVNAIVGPPFARMTDQCGRKYPVLVCCVFGVLGIMLIAGAKSMNMAIAGSAIFGLYWAVLGATAAIASEVLPRRHRGTAQIAFQWFGTLGVPLGTLGGAGFILHQPGGYAGWRSLFWFIAAMLAVGGLIFALCYHPPAWPNPSGMSYRARAFNWDIVGTALWACFLCPLMMALIWGGGEYTWSSPAIISTLTIAFFFLVVFAVHQTFIKKDGLFHHQLFQSRNFVICLIGLFVEGMVYISFTSYFGEESAVLYDARPVQFAARFNVFTLGSLIGHPTFAIIVYKFRAVKECLIFGFVGFLAAFAGLASCGANSSNVTLGMGGLAGFCFAAPIALIQTVIQFAVAPEFIGVSTALALCMRSVGGAVGTAIANAVFAHKLAAALPAYIASAAIGAGLPASSVATFVGGIATSNLTLAESAPGVTPAILEAGGAAALNAFAHSFRYVWIVQIPFVCLAVIAVLCMQSVKHQMNALVDKPVEAIHHKQHVEGGHIDDGHFVSGAQ